MQLVTGLLKLVVGLGASGGSGVALSGGSGDAGAQSGILWVAIRGIKAAKDRWCPKLADPWLYVLGLALGPLAVVGYGQATGAPMPDLYHALTEGLRAFAAALVGQNGMKQIGEITK